MPNLRKPHSRRRFHQKDSCAGKYRYLSLSQAEMEIVRANELRGEILRAYDCLKCGKIHLTSKEKIA